MFILERWWSLNHGDRLYMCVSNRCSDFSCKERGLSKIYMVGEMEAEPQVDQPEALKGQSPSPKTAWVLGVSVVNTGYLHTTLLGMLFETAPAAAKSFQSCPTLCDPIDGSPPGSPVPGIFQARTLERVAISFFNAGSEKWKWSSSVVSDSVRPHGLQPTRLLHPWDFPGKSTGVGCHRLLCIWNGWGWGSQRVGVPEIWLVTPNRKSSFGRQIDLNLTSGK